MMDVHNAWKPEFVVTFALAHHRHWVLGVISGASVLWLPQRYSSTCWLLHIFAWLSRLWHVCNSIHWEQFSFSLEATGRSHFVPDLEVISHDIYYLWPRKGNSFIVELCIFIYFYLNVSYLHSLLYFLLSICLFFLFVPLFMHPLSFISFHNFISSFLFFSFLSSSSLFELYFSSFPRTCFLISVFSPFFLLCSYLCKLG
jgi:hypothetical protein